MDYLVKMEIVLVVELPLIICANQKGKFVLVQLHNVASPVVIITHAKPLVLNAHEQEEVILVYSKVNILQQILSLISSFLVVD